MTEGVVKKHRVLVCGTRFGQLYLNAFLEDHPRFVLAGILARGSERSRRLAFEFGVPLHTRVEDVPDGIDVACVVIRSGIVGGAGTELAIRLLERGIHVLQEHPVHPRDLERCFAAAERGGAAYRLNTFYPQGTEARRFIDAVRRSRAAEPPWFAEVTTSPQLLYSSLDILGRALGGLSGTLFSRPAPWDPALMAACGRGHLPFFVVQGVVAGVPLVLKLQSYVDPRDPDQHSLVMHRIAVGGPGGNVLLANSYGPVVWSQALYVPSYQEVGGAAGLGAGEEAARRLALPSARVLSPEPVPVWSEVVETEGPQAVLSALDDLADAAAGMGEPSEDYRRRTVELAETWRAAMAACGDFVETALDPPHFPELAAVPA